MDFVSADPSVVRSVKQRDLLDTWLRARGPSRPLPALADYRPDRIDDELEDMMGFDVEGEGLDARFVITQEGARLASAYGRNPSTSAPTAISMARSERNAMRGRFRPIAPA